MNYLSMLFQSSHSKITVVNRISSSLVVVLRAGFIFIGLVLTGCATQPVTMNASILDESDVSVHIVTTQNPGAGKMFGTGSQGLLDVAISSAATSEVSTFLAGKDGSEYNRLLDNIENQFKARNIAVTRHDRPMDFDAIPKLKAEKGEFDKDLSSVFSETDAKYILFMRLAGYGAARNYYGFIPTGAPAGVVLLDGAIVDRNSKLHWFIRESVALQPRFAKSVAGEWNEPPGYEALDQSLTDSWQLAEDGIIADIFGLSSVSAN